MKLIGLIRLGRDAELRFTGNGDPVLGFSGAFNYGRRDADGRQPSQWVDFAIFGQRAEKLAEHLLKGTQLFIVASDVHVETYEKRDGGQGVKLVARVDDVQFAGGRADGGEQRQAAPASRAPAQAPAPRQPSQKTGGGFDEMDDDIPF